MSILTSTINLSVTDRERTARLLSSRARWTQAGAFTMRMISRFLKDETAATAIEYGLITAGIAIAIITAVKGVGSALSTKFTVISTSLK
jgi:pilus assembly protein Flp/PilA